MEDINKLISKINQAKNNQDVRLIKEIISPEQSADVADALEHFEDNDILAIFRMLDSETGAEIITYLKPEIQEFLLSKSKDEEVKDLVEEMMSDDLVDIIDEMPTEIVSKVLRSTTSKRREEISNILKYDEESAGGIMSVDLIKLDQNKTIGEAIEIIREMHDEIDDIDDLYIVNNNEELKGTLEIKALILNPVDVKLSQIMNKKFVAVKITMDQEKVSSMFKKYDLNTLPVVDENNKLKGIITVDDAIDVMVEEATEDLRKIVGIHSSVEDKYFETSSWNMFKSRIGWLLIVLLLGTISQIIISLFMNKMGVTSENRTISLLIPMMIVVAAIVGTSAIQTTTMTIRSLALNQIKKKDIMMMIRKELISSLLITLIVILINIIRLLLIYLIQYKGITPECWKAIFASSLAIAIAIITSNIISILIPIGLKKIKLDPTLSSTPLVTTVVDIFSIAVFLGIGVALI